MYNKLGRPTIINSHEIFALRETAPIPPTAIVEDAAGIIVGRVPELMDEAKVLFVAISRDPRGEVSKMQYADGTVVRTNNLDFTNGLWPMAFDQLCQHRYLRTKSEGLNEFVLTELGNQVLRQITNA